MRIVPTFDESKDSLACLGWVMEGVAIEQFTFQGGEEALTECIVIAIAHRAHRRTDPGISTALTKGDGGVLTTPVRVMDHVLGSTLLHCHPERSEHQGCTQMRGHGPPDHLAAPDVDHDCQIQPTCTSMNNDFVKGLRDTNSKRYDLEQVISGSL